MKKIKISLAVLAVIFALTTAFTTEKDVLTVDGYYANKDKVAATGQPNPPGNQCEANIDAEIAALPLPKTLTQWAGLHCEDPTTRICAVRIVSNAITQQIDGSYKP